MSQETNSIDVYLEIGETRCFAAALDWPGWCRSGRGEEAALQALLDYGPRYGQVMQMARLDFQTPDGASALAVVERQPGNATTNFGAPAMALPGDSDPVDPVELDRWQAVLEACWQTFDGAVAAASGRSLRKGPRGGGRDLAKVVQHVLEVDQAYLKSLGGTLKPGAEDDPERALAQVRQAILTTLAAAAGGEIATRGPRGGVRWTPRYFVRRLAWHELDHAWEIEDRAE